MAMRLSRSIVGEVETKFATPRQNGMHTTDSIPKNEQWFHDPAHKKQFDDSMAWIASHPASDANTDAILTQLATKD